jgi:single-stranded DNA-binding protein
MFQFTGNVGKDAEVKSVAGKTVIEYSVAVYAGKDKEGVNQTLWVNCAKWVPGNQEPNLLDMPKKGDLVLIDGRPNPLRIYTTNAGVQGASLDVLVNKSEMLKRSAESSLSPKEFKPAPTTPASAPVSQTEPLDDLPF